MGFNQIRKVTLSCDGPCGTVLPETERAPEGWFKVMLMPYERLAAGVKGTKAQNMWLCPACKLKLCQITEAHFAWNKPEEARAAQEQEKTK